MNVRSLSPLLMAAFLLPSACTKDAATPTEPVQAGHDAHPGKPGKKPGVNPSGSPIVAAPAPTPAVDPALPEPCFVPTKLTSEPPAYLPGKALVLTRVMKPCVTRDGRPGVEKDTPWLAMGFPCTGGDGRVDLKGNYNAPKMVSFILGTDCGMSPGKDAVKKLVVDGFGMPAESRLMAYTPFVLQYWEIPGLDDADTGFAIELRSSAALEGLWAKFKAKEPIRVRLFGRDNAWGRGDNFFFVEGDLRYSGRTAFQLDVVQAKSLPKDEIEKVKARCEALRPKRNCLEVF